MMNNNLQIALITGRSRPNNWSLSPVQKAFLQKIVSEHKAVTMNFPWVMQSTPWVPTGLLHASINNAREYLGARSPNFVLRYRERSTCSRQQIIPYYFREVVASNYSISCIYHPRC